MNAQIVLDSYDGIKRNKHVTEWMNVRSIVIKESKQPDTESHRLNHSIYPKFWKRQSHSNRNQISSDLEPGVGKRGVLLRHPRKLFGVSKMFYI